MDRLIRSLVEKSGFSLHATRGIQTEFVAENKKGKVIVRLCLRLRPKMTAKMGVTYLTPNAALRWLYGKHLKQLAMALETKKITRPTDSETRQLLERATQAYIRHIQLWAENEIHEHIQALGQTGIRLVLVSHAVSGPGSKLGQTIVGGHVQAMLERTMSFKDWEQLKKNLQLLRIENKSCDKFKVREATNFGKRTRTRQP